MKGPPHQERLLAAFMRKLMLLEPAAHRIDNPAPQSSLASLSSAENLATAAGDAGSQALAQSPLSELLTTSLPDDLLVTVQSRDILLLLKVLESLNRYLSGPCYSLMQPYQGCIVMIHIYIMCIYIVCI